MDMDAWMGEFFFFLVFDQVTIPVPCIAKFERTTGALQEGRARNDQITERLTILGHAITFCFQ